MGSHPYFYFTPYQADVNAALQNLRQQEFQAGRYDPAIQQVDPGMMMMMFEFPPTEEAIAPGAQHPSIEAAIEAADASGTGSILDIQTISDTPQLLTACPLSTAETQALFGTERPTRSLVEGILIFDEETPSHWDATGYSIEEDFWDTIDRGSCRYIVVYEDDAPTEIFFVGFSID